MNQKRPRGPVPAAACDLVMKRRARRTGAPRRQPPLAHPLLLALLLRLVVGLVAVPPAAAAAERALELVLLPRRRARCLDGSPAGFYVDAAPDASSWIIFLQGGGQCDSHAACAARAKTALGSSRRWPAALRPTRGRDRYLPLLSSDRTVNPLADTLTGRVYVPYCTGDFHAGTRKKPVRLKKGAKRKWWFHGRRNLDAVVETLVAAHGLGDATEVLLMGVSAGAAGVFFNVDRIAAALPAAAVRGVPIAGLFSPAADDEGTSVATFGDFKRGKLEADTVYAGSGTANVWGVRVPGACAAALGARCTMSIGVLYPFIEAELFVVQNTWDSFDVDGLMGVPTRYRAFDEWVRVPEYATDRPAVKRYLLDYYRPAAVATFTGARKKAGDGLWMPACSLHFENVIICSEGMTGIGDHDLCSVRTAPIQPGSVSEGLTPPQTFLWWYRGGRNGKHRVVDDCGGGGLEVDCNPECIVPWLQAYL